MFLDFPFLPCWTTGWTFSVQGLALQYELGGASAAGRPQQLPKQLQIEPRFN
jgi:hypothetical protein